MTDIFALGEAPRHTFVLHTPETHCCTYWKTATAILTHFLLDRSTFVFIPLRRTHCQKHTVSCKIRVHAVTERTLKSAVKALQPCKCNCNYSPSYEEARRLAEKFITAWPNDWICLSIASKNRCKKLPLTPLKWVNSSVATRTDALTAKGKLSVHCGIWKLKESVLLPLLECQLCINACLFLSICDTRKWHFEMIDKEVWKKCAYDKQKKGIHMGYKGTAAFE